MPRSEPVRIAITGADGFLGAVLTSRLRSRGSTSVRVLPLGRSIDLLGNDLRREIEAYRPDAIIHLAGKTPRNGVSAPTEDEYQEVNVEGTRRLVEMAASCDSAPAIVFASSILSYAATQEGAPTAIAESSATRDIAGDAIAYVSSKLRAERIILDHATVGPRATIARLTWTFGPTQKPGFDVPDMAARLAEAAAKGGSFQVFSPDERLDRISDIEAADAFAMLAFHAVRMGPVGRLVNISGGSAQSTRRLAKDMQRLAGTDCEYDFVEGSKRLAFFDNSALRKREVGWYPAIATREERLIATIQQAMKAQGLEMPLANRYVGPHF